MYAYLVFRRIGYGTGPRSKTLSWDQDLGKANDLPVEKDQPPHRDACWARDYGPKFL